MFLMLFNILLQDLSLELAVKLDFTTANTMINNARVVFTERFGFEDAANMNFDCTPETLGNVFMK